MDKQLTTTTVEFECFGDTWSFMVKGGFATIYDSDFDDICRFGVTREQEHFLVNNTDLLVVIVQVYKKAFRYGESVGEGKAQYAIRKAIGL